jgi:hypothetical protein
MTRAPFAGGVKAISVLSILGRLRLNANLSAVDENSTAPEILRMVPASMENAQYPQPRLQAAADIRPSLMRGSVMASSCGSCSFCSESIMSVAKKTACKPASRVVNRVWLSEPMHHIPGCFRCVPAIPAQELFWFKQSSLGNQAAVNMSYTTEPTTALVAEE